MSKRSQTTGLPKDAPNKAPAAAPAEPTPAGEKSKKPAAPIQREHKSRAEREHEIQRWVIIGTAVAVAVVLIMLVATFVIDQVIIPNQTVATVDGTNISVVQFQRRFRFERYVTNQRLVNTLQQFEQFGINSEQFFQQYAQQEPYATWIQQLQVPDTMAQSVVDQIVEDEQIRKAAAERGVSVTQADIDEQIRTFLGIQPPEEIPATEATAEATGEATPTITPTPSPTAIVSPTPSPTPTLTPTPELTATPSATPLPTLPPEPTQSVEEITRQNDQTRDNFFREIRRATGMTDGDLRAYFEVRALRTKLQDNVASDVTDKGLFADTRHILVATEEEANDVVAALNAGESFADLARAVSTDQSNAPRGGELGWAPVTNYVREFQDAITTGAIGQVLGPVKTEFGFHIIQVRAREERDLTEDQQNQAKASAFNTWFETYKETNADKVQTFGTWANYIPTEPRSIFDR